MKFNFKTLIPKMEFVRKKEEFDSIAGHEDIKKLTILAYECPESYNLAYQGSPATGKTLLLGELRKKYDEKCVYQQGVRISGAGLVELLRKYKEQELCLIVDELDKVDLKVQKMLLELLEGGEVITTLAKASYTIKFKVVKFFASLNDEDQLYPALRSRLQILHLPDYTEEEFSDIAVKILPKVKVETARYIAFRVWGGNKDVRDILKVGKLIQKKHSEQDVDWIMDTLERYGAPKE